MSYQFLKDILPYLEAYEKQASRSSDIRDFAHWILARDEFASSPEQVMQQPFKEGAAQGDMPGQICQLLYLMTKYIKFYLRKHLPSLSGPDDFGFLAALAFGGSMRKNTLVEYNTMELSSGMEVIRRLERKGFILSKPDPEDLRAKLVELSEKGRGYFFSLLAPMQEIGQFALANTPRDEQARLLQTLLRLQDFHQPIFREAKKESFLQIQERLK